MNYFEFNIEINLELFFCSNFLERFETFHEAQLATDQYEGQDRTSYLGKDFFLLCWELARTNFVPN
jgi:hypothetical protein